MNCKGVLAVRDVENRECFSTHKLNHTSCQSSPNYEISYQGVRSSTFTFPFMQFPSPWRVPNHCEQTRTLGGCHALLHPQSGAENGTSREKCIGLVCLIGFGGRGWKMWGFLCRIGFFYSEWYETSKITVQIQNILGEHFSWKKIQKLSKIEIIFPGGPQTDGRMSFDKLLLGLARHYEKQRRKKFSLTRMRNISCREKFGVFLPGVSGCELIKIWNHLQVGMEQQKRRKLSIKFVFAMQKS